MLFRWARSGKIGYVMIVAATVAIVAVMTISSSSSPLLGLGSGSHGSNGRSATTSSIETGPGDHGLPRTAPLVEYTLDLCNNTLYSGNFLGTNCTTYNPFTIAYDSGNGEMFVADWGNSNVTVISTATDHIVANIALAAGAYPAGIVYDSGMGEVFVGDRDTNTVTVISDTTDSIVATIPVGEDPGSVAYDPVRGDVYVADRNSNEVSVISDSSNQVIATIPVGGWPYGITYDSRMGEMFTANFDSDDVSVINDTTNTVTATIPAGSVPYAIAYDSGKGQVFVLNQASANVSVISDATDKIVASVAVGPNPRAIGYDSDSGVLFVANSYSQNVTIINDTTDRASALLVGLGPDGVAFDTQDNIAYVSSDNLSSIAIIQVSPEAPQDYQALFSERGLPNGTRWSVSLPGNSISSTVPTISFSEPNGSYAFTVGSVAGYMSSPSSGNIVVSGANVSEPISFTQISQPDFIADFNETGLPAGTNWSVTLSGQQAYSTHHSISFTKTNGTYTFTIAGVSGYSVSPQSGNLTISGNPVTVIVKFTTIPPEMFPVLFTESGLAKGSNWSVDLNAQLEASSNTSITFSETAGSFGFTVSSFPGYVASPSSGSVLVINSSVKVAITFVSTAVPVLQIDASPLTGSAPLVVDFSANLSGGVAPFAYAWVFGDGSSGQGVSVQHTYTSQGTYFVSLVVTGANGLSAQANTSVVVYNDSTVSGALELSIAASPATGPAPLTVVFDTLVSGGTSPYDYAWDFGDGGNTTGVIHNGELTTVHTYVTSGIFAATLCVNDSSGQQALTGAFIDVYGDNAGHMAAFVSVGSLSGEAPFNVTFSPAVSGGTAPYTLNWSFGDGTYEETTSLAPVTHTYTKSGSYVVELTVKDPDGVSTEWSTTLQGSGHPVVVTGQKSSPHNTSAYGPWLLFLVVVAAAVVLTAAVIAMKQKRRRKLVAAEVVTSLGQSRQHRGPETEQMAKPPRNGGSGPRKGSDTADEGSNPLDGIL